MISLSSVLCDKSEKMNELLINMDTQLRVYLWTIAEMNRIRAATELKNPIRNLIYKKGVSHYKKRWRDRYIKPDSTPLSFQDPLKMMDKLVNDSHTYHHVMEFKNGLAHIVEEPNAVQFSVGLKYPHLYR